MSRASDIKYKISSAMNEDALNEDRLRIVVIDADDQSAGQVSDILGKALSKSDFDPMTISLPTVKEEPCEPICGSPDNPCRVRGSKQPNPSPPDRSDFVCGNAVRPSHFFDMCKCNSCGYELHKNIVGVSCSNISCPKCGARMGEVDTEVKTSGWNVASKPSSSDF
jgi:hypothetical protein